MTSGFILPEGRTWTFCRLLVSPPPCAAFYGSALPPPRFIWCGLYSSHWFCNGYPLPPPPFGSACLRLLLLTPFCDITLPTVLHAHPRFLWVLPPPALPHCVLLVGWHRFYYGRDVRDLPTFAAPFQFFPTAFLPAAVCPRLTYRFCQLIMPAFCCCTPYLWWKNLFSTFAAFPGKGKFSPRHAAPRRGYHALTWVLVGCTPRLRFFCMYNGWLPPYYLSTPTNFSGDFQTSLYLHSGSVVHATPLAAPFYYAGSSTTLRTTTYYYHFCLLVGLPATTGSLNFGSLGFCTYTLYACIHCGSPYHISFHFSPLCCVLPRFTGSFAFHALPRHWFCSLVLLLPVCNNFAGSCHFGKARRTHAPWHCFYHTHTHATTTFGYTLLTSLPGSLVLQHFTQFVHTVTTTTHVPFPTTPGLPT